MSIYSNWNSKHPTKSEISNFDDSIFVNEQVLWFQIAVQNSSSVTIENPFQNLNEKDVIFTHTSKKKKSNLTIPDNNKIWQVFYPSAVP